MIYSFVNILMFHSISDGQGPACIPPAVFREQLCVLADCGFRGVSLREYVAWRRGELELHQPFAVLTFDDGYQDFVTAVFPELRARGWNGTVFLPSSKVGQTNDWQGARHDVRLIEWRTTTELAKSGVEFGAHGMTHTDLTRLPVGQADFEILNSKRTIEDHTADRVISFAPPYGRSNSRVRDQIARHYLAAAGTTLGRATSQSDPFDFPRIEMWYFRDIKRWQYYLEHGSSSYYSFRRLMRLARTVGSR
jgi:peptidoglycan/xylan/chitin deacetylase (PgdA/CDA1 family)